MAARLREAASSGNTQLLLRLLDEGAKVLPDEDGCNALHLAASAGHSDVVAALLLAGCDVNTVDSVGCTALQRASAEGHIDVVKQLIKHGANVNQQDTVHGNTALHEASWKGFSRTVATICKAKANFHLKNCGGFAALHLCCQNGHNQSCRELLLAGCNPDLQNNYGDSPLHTSARYGHAGVTRILISAQCKVSDQNKNGDTALHIAAAMGRRKLTRILLEAGCDRNLKNKQNETAKDIATRKELNEILAILNTVCPIKSTKSKSDTKREKESGSSKDSSGRHKEKKKMKNTHKVQFGKVSGHEWSPYGCHYYPDPKAFPEPKLDSLPQEPLKKGEQYYLDLAGNICKGPIGVGYTCYCAPFFRHMEARLDKDKDELKEHINTALEQRVSSLEQRTQGQLAELTRCVAAERALCEQRHEHLVRWLTRGAGGRCSERIRGSVPPIPVIRPQRARSLEFLLDSVENQENIQDYQKQHNRSLHTLLDNCAREHNRSFNTILDSEISQDGSNEHNLSLDKPIIHTRYKAVSTDQVSSINDCEDHNDTSQNYNKSLNALVNTSQNEKQSKLLKYRSQISQALTNYEKIEQPSTDNITANPHANERFIRKDFPPLITSSSKVQSEDKTELGLYKDKRFSSPSQWPPQNFESKKSDMLDKTAEESVHYEENVSEPIIKTSSIVNVPKHRNKGDFQLTDHDRNVSSFPHFPGRPDNSSFNIRNVDSFNRISRQDFHKNFSQSPYNEKHLSQFETNFSKQVQGKKVNMMHQHGQIDHVNIPRSQHTENVDKNVWPRRSVQEIVARLQAQVPASSESSEAEDNDEPRDYENIGALPYRSRTAVYSPTHEPDPHNDSGYSTKLYGSSKGASPSLSGQLECDSGFVQNNVNVRIGHSKSRYEAQEDPNTVTASLV